MVRAAQAAALATVVLALGACGDSAEDGGGGVEERPAEGGTLTFALASEPDPVDPLYADDRSSQIVARQIYEPLTDTLSGPFGDVRELPGLAPVIGASRDESVWRFRLRPRVRFQNGEPFNASAVLVNAERWIASRPGRALLPALVGVDAPRPDLVRFILDRHDPGFAERLADPRLGLVSPRALRSGPGGALRLDARAAPTGAGTGPFELRELGSNAPVVLARNTEWWGARLELGPALDQLLFPVVAEGERRVAALVGGDAEVADDLSPAEAREVRSDPLLTVSGARPGSIIGFERSVRGIGPGGEIPALSDVWLTTTGTG